MLDDAHRGRGAVQFEHAGERGLGVQIIIVAQGSAVDLAGVAHAGEVEPRELVDAAIARAERVNPEINAIATPLFERARLAWRGLA